MSQECIPWCTQSIAATGAGRALQTLLHAGDAFFSAGKAPHWLVHVGSMHISACIAPQRSGHARDSLVLAGNIF